MKNIPEIQKQLEGLMDVIEVAEILGLSRSKVYDLLSRNELPHYRIGGTYRVSMEQLQRYLQSRERGGQPEQPAPKSEPPKLKHLSI